VPTAREQGLEVSLEAWRGIAAPKGTPKSAIATLEAAIRKTAESPISFRPARSWACVPPLCRPRSWNPDREGDAELARIMQLIGLKK